MGRIWVFQRFFVLKTALFLVLLFM